MNRLRPGRVFWIGAAAILVAAAAVALAAVLRGDFSDTDWRILATLAALLYTGGTALSGLALADRGRARAVAWAVVAAAPVSLALVLWAVWRFVGDGDGETEVKLAWSSVLALLAGLVSTTGLLLARGPLLVRLAGAAGVLAALAAGLSVTGVWTEPASDTFVKALAALWILAGLGYFLVPVLGRFSSAAAEEHAVRVLAELDGVELVASRGPVEGVRVEPPVPGERLVLRRRPPGL
ncbi:MAG TPA: hypothetical protein VNK94_11660 [Gaiellaceae bacterium]|nr:hypothetical protein [Gaiellaceae bacterium]